MNSLDKNLIKERFEKNLATYADNAVVQKHMASELVASLVYNVAQSKPFSPDDGGLVNPPYFDDSSHALIAPQPNFNKILEIGCGTGTLTKKILNEFNFKELFVNDIVENSLYKDIQSDKIIKLYGDCEKIQFPQCLDLVISNATFQWLQNLPEILNKIHTSLNKGAILAFSTFENWNLYQVSTLTQKTLNYYTKSDLEEILKQNFTIIHSFSQTMEIEFDSAQEVLKHLKLTGVNGLISTKWTKSDLQKFSEKYNHLFKNNKGKLVLTYKPVWFICAKIDMIVDEAEPSRTSMSLRGGL